MKNRFKTQCKLIALGAIPTIGFLAFYLVPLGMTFKYSFMKSAFDSVPAGFDNYSYVWENEYFLLGLSNLLKMGLFCCTFAFITAMHLSFLTLRHRRLAGLALAVLLLPLMIPSVCAVNLWKKVFEINILTPPFIAFFALTALFIWKCAGTAALILYTALSQLPQDIMDAASLDGCSEMRLFFSIRFPMIRPQAALAVLFLSMFYFRLYKESYLMFGLYPPEQMYLVQHYMNNQYLKMNAQYVSAAAGSLAMICVFLFSFTFVIRGKRYRLC